MLGRYPRDVIKLNQHPRIFRLFGPDETNSNRLNAVFEATERQWVAERIPGDDHPAPQWLTMDQAVKHCTAGIGIWEWASTDRGSEPDVIMACAGDVPTLETLAAVKLLREFAPELVNPSMEASGSPSWRSASGQDQFCEALLSRSINS